MTAADSTEAGHAGAARIFATTHWSVVLTAKDSGDHDGAEALEKLCRAYWYPLYAYIRRRGRTQDDAQDLTQGFFAHLLEKQTIEKVDQAKGKFRSFLLSCLNHYLAHESERARAQKRGGGSEVFSLDSVEAEQRYRHEPRDDRSPEKIFEYRWAMTLLDHVLAQLANEFQQAGKEQLFGRMRPFLVDGKGNGTSAQTAKEIGMTDDAFKKAVQRMRRRYGELFRAEIAQTVSDAKEVDEELRYLGAIFNS